MSQGGGACEVPWEIGQKQIILFAKWKSFKISDSSFSLLDFKHIHVICLPIIFTFVTMTKAVLVSSRVVK